MKAEGDEGDTLSRVNVALFKHRRGSVLMLVGACVNVFRRLGGEGGEFAWKNDPATFL